MGYYEKLVEYYNNTPREEIDRVWALSADCDECGEKFFSVFEKMVEYHNNTPREEIERVWALSADWNKYGMRIGDCNFGYSFLPVQKVFKFKSSIELKVSHVSSPFDINYNPNIPLTNCFAC